MNKLAKVLTLFVILISITSASLAETNTKLDIVTRNFVEASGNITGEVKVSWYGNRVDEKQYAIVVTDDDGNQLKSEQLDIPSNSINASLTHDGFYTSEWIKIKIDGLIKVPKSIDVSITPQSATQRVKSEFAKLARKNVRFASFSYQAKKNKR